MLCWLLKISKAYHAECSVKARCVAQECRQSGFEEQGEVEEVVSHTLVDKRVPSGLANNEIRPLDNHNGNKESCLTGVL